MGEMMEKMVVGYDNNNIREVINEIYDQCIVFEPEYYDEAIIGVDVRDERVVYDYDKLIQIGIDHMELSRLESIEHVQVNMVGMSLGKHTPQIICPVDIRI